MPKRNKYRNQLPQGHNLEDSSTCFFTFRFVSFVLTFQISLLSRVYGVLLHLCPELKSNSKDVNLHGLQLGPVNAFCFGNDSPLLMPFDAAILGIVTCSISCTFIFGGFCLCFVLFFAFVT